MRRLIAAVTVILALAACTAEGPVKTVTDQPLEAAAGRIAVPADVVEAAPERRTELAAVVQAERDFAARAQVVNARQAFAESFAPDAIAYTPFPTPAFPALSEPGEGWNVNIQWRPTAAAISGAGDMGYTTGPAEYRKTAADSPHAFSHYTSVWERQPGGGYKVAIDIGVDHPGPVSSIPDWTAPAIAPRAAPVVSAAAREAARRRLLAVDAAAGEAAVVDAPGTISQLLVNDGRYHQSGALPSIGRDAALTRLRANGQKQRWAPDGGKVAASADFGFTYGRGSLTPVAPAAATAGGEFGYLNVWQKRGGEWKLLVRVVSPVPAPAAP